MAKSLMWRPILSSARGHHPHRLLHNQAAPSSSLLQLPQRCFLSHKSVLSTKTQANFLFWSSTHNGTTELPVECGCLKLSKLGFGLAGYRRFSVRATNVNDAGSIDSPLMQSMEKKIKEHLSAESVSVKDAYGDGRHVSIDVISSAFEGQSAVNRQRMVYKAIWEELQSTVHAVDQMTTKTPAEAEAKK
ncbi:protein BOLA4, chloroplastic/mitochondrial [Euphorbia lathyris]|uniref:protein BOLA4, chloroplastic/mitochondrial n=1 Tax=Euphorbia lathyris TaxID=212925 RepID=UPI003313179A